MRILDERVERYLHELRPKRSPVMAEMEAVAERDSVPIVHWETGRFLAAICRAMDPSVLEVGTAIGYSTLHMAEQLASGRVVTLERDTIGGLKGPFDVLFVDAAKGEYARYIELAEPLLSDRALLVVDNLLMSGEVALEAGAETRWNPDSLAAARRLNVDLMNSERWLACVLAVGDGIGVAARRH